MVVTGLSGQPCKIRAERSEEDSETTLLRSKCQGIRRRADDF